MKLLPRRRSHEEAGRRRPLPTEPNQSRTFSYYNSRLPGEANVGRASVQQALEKNRRKRPKWRGMLKQFPLIVAAVIIVACAASELSLSTTPKIVPLASPGGQLFLRSPLAYQQAASQLFSRSWGNRNKLTVDTAGISSSLEHNFPELSSVSVALPTLGRKPVVYIQPVEPALILKTVNGTFVLDSAGRALVAANAVAPRLSQLSLPTVTDQTGIQANVGAVVLPSSDADFVHTVASQLNAQNIRVSKFVLPPAASELDAYIAGTAYFVKFNLQNDPLQQIGTFVAVQRHLAAAHKAPSQYIDVRINGRAYYK